MKHGSMPIAAAGVAMLMFSASCSQDEERPVGQSEEACARAIVPLPVVFEIAHETHRLQGTKRVPFRLYRPDEGARTPAIESVSTRALSGPGGLLWTTVTDDNWGVSWTSSTLSEVL